MRPSRAAAALVLLPLAGACSSSADDGTAAVTTMAPRPARYDSCPASGIVAPASMTLIDRQRPNLGNGSLGRVDVYSDDTRQIEIGVGVDVLDGFEDLDFVVTEVMIGDVSGQVSAAGAFGTDDRLVVVTWTDPSIESPCDALSIVASNVSADEVVAIASAPRSATAEP